jgi:DNA-binding CsgD family transcriptional regulator
MIEVDFMDFTVILSFEQTKLLELIQLLQQKEELFSVADLANHLLVSQKTLVGYLKKIQAKIAASDEKQNCQIAFLKGGWITYQERDDCATERFRLYYLRNIPELRILKHLLQAQLTIPELQRCFQISESSVRKKMQKIQKWLSQYQIFIGRKDFKIAGNEWQIRRLYLNFYHFLQEPLPFEADSKVNICYLARQISCFFEMNLNVIRQKQLISLIFIVYQRSRYQPIQITKKWQLFLMKSQLFLRFQGKVSAKLKLSLNEQMYLFLMIEAIFGSYFGVKMQCFFIQEYTQQDNKIYQATLFVMRQIKLTFNQTMFYYCEHNFCNFLSTHLQVYLLQEASVKDKEQLESGHTYYPVSIEKLKVIAQELQCLFPDFAVVDSQILALSYFYKIRKLFNPILCEKKYFLCVVTDFSLEKEQLFGEALSDYFLHRKNVAIIYGKKASTVKYAHVFIVSPFISETLLEAKGKPIIFIPKQINELFFRKIEAYLNE